MIQPLNVGRSDARTGALIYIFKKSYIKGYKKLVWDYFFIFGMFEIWAF